MSQEKIMAENVSNERDWADLAISLYDRLTGRGSEISYEFDNMEINVPSGTHDNARFANWRVNGTLRIRARDTVH